MAQSTQTHPDPALGDDVVLLTVPWWVRLVGEIGAERRARIRVEERDEIAAHLHDSVLQTLALIQKQSGDDVAGREVRRLARRQERELRSWLHGRSADDDGDPLVTTAGHATVAGALAAAVRAAADAGQAGELDALERELTDVLFDLT